MAFVADALMILLLYYAFAFLYKDLFWVQELNLQRASLLVLIGGIGAVVTEM